MTEANHPQETCPAELPNFCAQRHWSIFWILILCSLGMVCGRIMTVSNQGAKNKTPFFSANDRSRWATIRALGDHGTYAIDQVTTRDQEIRWDTIDKVRHLGDDNQFHFYSSKPTLTPTLLAGVYQLVKPFTGSLAEQPVTAARVILLLFNGASWFLFLYFFALTINAIPVRDWTRYYALACAGFGTFLTTFSVTLNNHLTAAAAIMVSFYFVSTIWRKETAPPWMFAMAGLFGAFGVANEFPALAFFAFAGLFCLLKSPVKTLTAFLIPAVLVAAGLMGTNYAAHGTWKPAYAHRSDGEQLAIINGDFSDSLNQGRVPAELQNNLKTMFEYVSLQAEPDGWPSTPEDTNRWVLRDLVGTTQVAIQNQKGTDRFTIHAWGNWYDYPNSYWSKVNQDRKSDVDKGQESLEVYAFHLFFGHHGIFSLTPIWLLAFAGMVALAFGSKIAGRFQMKWLGVMTIAITVAVLVFYLRRPAMDRNYGGVTSGLRWVFWLAPLWLTCMLPIIDWLASTKWGKMTCYVLLVASILSAAYSANNPWVHPWLYQIWDLTGLAK